VRLQAAAALLPPSHHFDVEAHAQAGFVWGDAQRFSGSNRFLVSACRLALILFEDILGNSDNPAKCTEKKPMSRVLDENLAGVLAETSALSSSRSACRIRGRMSAGADSSALP
jgi:hypothetical protein